MANLDSVSAETLRDLLDRVDDVAATKRLMVAIAYKEIDGLSQNAAAATFGYSSGWASRWFRRLDRLDTEPHEAVLYDDARPGRPPKLSQDQRQRFQTAVRASPREAGFEADVWTVRLAARYLASTYGVEYSDRHVRRLLREAGLTSQDGAESATGTEAGRGPGRPTGWTRSGRT